MSLWYVIKSDDDSYLMHHGTKGQHWGIRNGPPYPLSSSKVAKKLYDTGKQKIVKIEADVSNAANKAGSKLYGLENRLKTEQSINRKLNKNVKEKGLTLSEASDDIKDIVRFTTLSPDNTFVDSYNTFKKELTSKGYTETRCKNYFSLFNQGKVKHKAVQSTFSTDDGYQFEVQFHTKDSQDVKNKKVPLYEEVRQVGISKKRASEIENKMYQMALNIPDPKGIETIRSHG